MADMVTKQELEAAKIDVKHAGEAVNEKKIVTPRYGESFKSLPLAIQEVIETGGFEPFATEAELKASIPVLEKKAAYSLDTHKVFLWESEIWKDTGLSAIDQAKTYADEKDQESKDLINSIAKEVMSLLFKSQSSESLFDFTDTEGSIVLQILRDGRLQLVGLDKDVQQSVSEINDDIAEQKQTLSSKNDADIFYLIDGDDNIVAQVRSNGELHLTGLTGSVQKEFQNIDQRIGYGSDNYLYRLLDDDGNIVLEIDKDSKIHIVGLESDLASTIANNKATVGLTDTSNLSNYAYKDTFIPKAERLLNFFRNTQNTGLLAPVPLQSFEQNISIGTTWINDAVISEWGDYIPVKTPYGNNRGVVHPQILEFPNKFMGCRYILAITGYTNGNTKEENPFLLGSDDLQNFELLTPLIDEPESYTWDKGIIYNSDPFMFYDIKTGELVLTFREYWADTSGVSPSQTHEFIYAKRTKDGKEWSKRELIYGGYTGTFLSPAFLYDVLTEIWHMYGITTSGGRNLAHFTSKTLDNNWTFVGNCNLPVGTAAWHVDLKIIGDKQVATFQNRSGQDSIGFRTGISDDFHNFEWANDWWNPPTHEVYKASFLPQFNDQNQMRLVYVWTTNHKPVTELKYKLFVQATPFLNVDYLEK